MAKHGQSPARPRSARPAVQTMAHPRVRQTAVTATNPRTTARNTAAPAATTPATPGTPATPATPATPVAPATAPAAPGTLAALMERGAQQILAVTYWFEPAPRPQPYPVTVRFTGRRLGVEGKPQQGDEFVHDETIKHVLPGSGPISLTARVHGVNPGEWEVNAAVLDPFRMTNSARAATRGREPEPLARPLDGASDSALDGIARLWLRWAPSVNPAVPLKTTLEPYYRAPGLIPLSWITLVIVGMIVALVTQALLLAHLHLSTGPVTVSTLISLALGAIGGKVWYIVKHRAEHDFIGWCIQGFIVGATVGMVTTLTIAQAPLGPVLDATAPGLMFGMAIGRLGCFFAGCCGGPPTAARWGVWCSDQHVGARRVPTQLLESSLSLTLGLMALLALLTHGLAGGAYFAAVVAAYTLCREGILRLRAETVAQRLPIPVTAVASALVLVVAVSAAIVVR